MNGGTIVQFTLLFSKCYIVKGRFIVTNHLFEDSACTCKHFQMFSPVLPNASSTFNVPVTLWTSNCAFPRDPMPFRHPGILTIVVPVHPNILQRSAFSKPLYHQWLSALLYYIMSVFQPSSGSLAHITFQSSSFYMHPEHSCLLVEPSLHWINNNK